MTQSLPIILVPAMMCTPRMYAQQIPALWQFGPVTVADHRRHDNMTDLARSILEHAPKRFALAGLSMGGYIALEVVRQAPERVDRLALLATSARPDTPAQANLRKAQIAMARAGEYSKSMASSLPLLVHRQNDKVLNKTLLQMARETGADAFVRQLQANLGRADSRPLLASIGCPTLVLAAAYDRLLPPPHSQEIAAAIPGARYVELPDCGHAASLDCPELTTEALVTWLQVKAEV